ncbi:30S ribosomal protein S4 [Spirochaetota bacterium]|nr:30S ribosomal protein S4 [Spirochaetota bacterium]
MAGYSGPKNKIAKRFNVNLWGRSVSPLGTKNTPSRGRKKSDFALQLEEKQKLRYFYGGIRERQFKRYFKEAKRQGGNIGNNFLTLLEKRLDVAVYRLNIAVTIFAARQFVSHGHILVNGKRVNIPSYSLKDGDEISVKEKSRSLPLIQSHINEPERSIPPYVFIDSQTLTGKFERLPEREEISYPFQLNEALVIEFYSK